MSSCRHQISRRALLGAVGVAALTGPAAAEAAGVKVAVQGFGSASLLGPNATEDSLVTILIEELMAGGGWIVVDETGAAPGEAEALVLRGVVTRFEASGGTGLDIGGMTRGLGGIGGRGGVKAETFSLAVSLRLLHPKTRQVLGVAAGAAQAKARGVRGGVDTRSGATLGGERMKNPAIEQAARDAIRQAIAKLLPAAQKVQAG